MAESQQQRGTTVTTGGIKLNCLVVAVIAWLSSTISLHVEGAPILGPDLDSCRPVIPPRRTAADSVECCFADTGRPIKEFKYNTDLPIRVRKAVHKLDEEYIRKYERAYELLRALPPHDPRSWEAQSKLHCAYCAEAYSQFNSSATLDVHHGWLLMPFHRWYLYFHERILATLIGDDTFAIPYWAWDVQDETSPPANIMPYMFTNVSSPLYDPFRCHIHRPPHRVDLKIQVTPHNRQPEELTRSNHYNMWRVMIGETQTAEAFFGKKVSQGDEVESKAGRFETGPHAAVHGWTGDETTPFGEDMAPAYTAAKDPLFFAHHSQVDRLWLMWNGLGGRNFDHPDWLDAEFLFYDENADMVRVNIRDCLDIEKLRVSYDQVPAEWLDYTPRSIREIDPKNRRNGIVGRVWRQVFGGEMFMNMARTLGRILWREVKATDVVWGGGRAVLTSRVVRPKVSSTRGMVENVSSSNVSLAYDEVLVVSGVVKKPFDAMVLFNLFLELPEADESTPLYCAESLGDVYLEPEGLQIGEDPSVTRKFSHTIGIGERLRILDVGRQSTVTVTFVPAWDSQYDSDISIRFTELTIELQLARW
ncbi:unnamed protein product [Calypogeia fissa]